MKTVNTKCVLFSLPNLPEVYKLEDENTGKFKIEFVDFLQKKKVIFSSNQIKRIHLEDWQSEFSLSNKEKEKEVTEAEYCKKIVEAVETLAHYSMPKIVISRKKTIQKSVNPLKVFTQLQQKNPSAFTYLMYDNTYNCWVGATPETLLIQENSTFKTMSLAGTLPLQEEWTTKEYEEQQLVTDYIKKSFEEVGLKPMISETQELKNATFKHLVSYISANAKANEFEKVVSKLHPTPAVCGIPKETAKKCIQKIENYDRAFYSGYISLQLENKKLSFVNLRCAKLYKNAVDIFVGGGILTNSNPKKEWQETELKAKVIEESLG